MGCTHEKHVVWLTCSKCLMKLLIRIAWEAPLSPLMCIWWLFTRLVIFISDLFISFGAEVYSFIKSQVTYRTMPHMFTINVQVIRNTAHRPSTQASYTIGSRTTMQENQPAAQIAAKHNIFSRMSWIYLVLVGIYPGVSRLGGEIASHNTTDARQLFNWP